MFEKKKEPEKLEANPEMVSCEDCKHLVRYGDAQHVKMVDTVCSFDSIYRIFLENTLLHFCPEHRKNYERGEMRGGGEVKYFKEFQVSKHGTPIGYQEIAEKQSKKKYPQ